MRVSTGEAYLEALEVEGQHPGKAAEGVLQSVGGCLGAALLTPLLQAFLLRPDRSSSVTWGVSLNKGREAWSGSVRGCAVLARACAVMQGRLQLGDGA